MSRDFHTHEHLRDDDGHRPLAPYGVDERGVPVVRREEGASPTRDLRVEALQRTKALRQLLAVLVEEVDELGSMLHSGHGNTRNPNIRERQHGATLSATPAPSVPPQVRAARAAKAAQAYRSQPRPTGGPVGGPGSSLR